MFGQLCYWDAPCLDDLSFKMLGELEFGIILLCVSMCDLSCSTNVLAHAQELGEFHTGQIWVVYYIYLYVVIYIYQISIVIGHGVYLYYIFMILYAHVHVLIDLVIYSRQKYIDMYIYIYVYIYIYTCMHYITIQYSFNTVQSIDHTYWQRKAAGTRLFYVSYVFHISPIHQTLQDAESLKRQDLVVSAFQSAGVKKSKLGPRTRDGGMGRKELTEKN